MKPRLKLLILINLISNFLMFSSIWWSDTWRTAENSEAMIQAELWLQDLSYLNFDENNYILISALALSAAPYFVGLIMIYFNYLAGRHVFLFGVISSYVFLSLLGYSIYSPIDILLTGIIAMIDGAIIYATYFLSKSKPEPNIFESRNDND